MVKDERYVAVRRMIDAGDITRLDQCFKIVPKTVVATHLKEHQGRFSTRMNNVAVIEVAEIYNLSQLFDVDVHEIFRLITNQYDSDKKNKRG
jgi:hypothetical protein